MVIQVSAKYIRSLKILRIIEILFKIDLITDQNAKVAKKHQERPQKASIPKLNI